jgi:hypothetical protein
VLTWTQVAIASESRQGHTDKQMEQVMSIDTFTHHALVEGVRAEFQVMSLASMNMKDPEGNTHHVMVKFFDESSQNQIKDARGKINLISPSGKERVETLKNYSGIFAANLTFAEKGKYGLICLFKVNGKERLVKFWYPHG